MTESDSRVSTLELFFDLVFVFTITQVAFIVEHHPWSAEAIAQAFVELVVIYWMYGGFAWLTNTLGSSAPRQRIVLLAGMAAFFVVSLSVPRAFGSDATAFGLAYLALNAVHLGGFLLPGSVMFGAMLRIGGTNLTAAGLILAAAWVDGDAKWPFWAAAVLVQIVPPRLTGTPANFSINVAHFAERHGLMIIIVLGESLVSVASAAHDLPVDLELVVGTLCGLAALAAMWWCYFGRDDDAAAARFARLPESRRGLTGLVGYGGSHVLMLSGVVAVAAGARLCLPDLTARVSTAVAGLLAGGTALYLVGLAAFRLALRYGPSGPRLAAAAIVLATIPVGTGIGAAEQLLALAALLAGLLVVETRGPAALRLPDPAG